jgi:acyl-CoA dehydrogenase
MKGFASFGSPIPGAEPYWYDSSFPSAYYNEKHVAFRAKCRDFVERELRPHVDEWVAKKEYPMKLHEKLYQAGISTVMWPRSVGGDLEEGEKRDYFLELIRVDEFSRTGGHVLGQEGINSMALPPIINFGSEKLKQMVCRPVVLGTKSCCLAISEPYAGT